MDAKGEMDAGDDQAPVEVDDDVSLKEVVAAELSDVSGKWKVSEQGTVGVEESSVGAELNIQDSASISTGDYSHIEDHEMDVVLMNGSIDNSAAGHSFGSVDERSNLAKQGSELGALGRYVVECSPGRDEFVVNEVDCLKDEPLEVFEADNEFGFQQRAEIEESEFENFVGAEETFEASQATGVIGYSAEGEGLRFQQLLAGDSEAEDNSNLLQYSRIDVTEAAVSSGASLEAEVGLFYGQVFEGSGRENPSHQPVGLPCSQIVGEGQAVDTSDYAAEGEVGSKLEPGMRSNIHQTLLCNTEGDNGTIFEKAVRKPDNILVAAVGTVETAEDEEPSPDHTSNLPGDLALFCATKVAMVSNHEEKMDRRVTSQDVIDLGAESTNTPGHRIFRPQAAADIHFVKISVASSASCCEELGERVQATGIFPEAERDLGDDSLRLADGAEALDFVDCAIGSGGGAVGQTGSEAPQVPHLNVGSVSSVDMDGVTRDNEIIGQIAELSPHEIVQSCGELVVGDYGTKQLDNEQQGTSSSVATTARQALAVDYGAAMKTHESSLLLLMGEAKDEHKLVACTTGSSNNGLRQNEPMRGADVQHELEASKHSLRHCKPSAKNCEEGRGAEVQGMLHRVVQNSEQSALIFDSADGSGASPEEYSLGGLKGQVGKCDVNKEASEDVQNADLSPQLCDGRLGSESAPVIFEAPSSSGDELIADTNQSLGEANGAETNVYMGLTGKQQPAMLREEFKCSQSPEKADARKEPIISADLGKVRAEIQPVSRSLVEVQNIDSLLPSGTARRDVQKMSSECMTPVDMRQLGVVADSVVQTTDALKSAERSAMPVVDDKVQTSQKERPLIQVSSADKSLQRVQTSDIVSEIQEIKVIAESAESPGTRKGRDDVKAKSPQRETVGIPLWVKWRGKWQPGIQCSTVDCPPATLKAKPSYSKKHYIVVYSPTARNYSWVDIQHTCPITENPSPLFSGTHDGGRDTVKDVFITRRRMLLKLGGEMLDISDRLHVKAVVESSRNVIVWKRFATEAAAATTYAELGTLLVSLHLAIVREFIKPTWMTKRYALWKEECVRAESAAAVQKLTKELINAVLWDDVGPLWNEPDQPELDPQWSNWKGEAFEEKEEPDADADGKSAGTSEKDGAQLKYPLAGGSKRFKEQARARRRRPQSPEASDSTPLKRSRHNPQSSEGVIVSRAITAFRSPLVHPSGLLQIQPYVPVLEADRCHEVISGDTLASLSGQVAPSNNEAFKQPLSSGDGSLQLASSSVSYHSDGSEGDESKVFERIGKSAAASMAEGLIALESGLCSAYLKNKGRRCNRFSKKEGVRYCEKHIYLLDPDGVGKKFGSEGNLASQSGLCSAFLRRENRRCARQAKDGFKGYCGFHVHLSTSGIDRNEVTDALTGEDGGVSHINSSSVKDDRCQGITTRGVQCTHRTKDGSSFCVKHSLKGATLVERDENKGQSLGASKMDWQKGGEAEVSPGTQELAGEVDADRDISSEPGSREGTMRTLELKSLDYSRGSEGSTRKRKALSSFFTDRAVGDPRLSAGPSQEATSPKFTDGKATQCKGRTTRNEEQCSFRAREGQEYCSKHLNAVEGKKKITFHRSVRKHEVLNSETMGFGARSLLHRFMKGVGGIWQSSESDAGNQLVQSTIVEAARDRTAEELVKLVTVEMTKLQMFLHPLDAVEGQKADVSLGTRFVESSSHSLPVVSEGPDSNRESSVLASLLPDEHRVLDDRPVSCGLCDVELPGVADLGRHWQLVHKKEVSLFVKGHACRVCDRLYTRKQTVMTHWKKRHPSVAMTNPDLSVCFACDVRYADDDGLLEHVIAVHPYQLSSSSLKEMIAQNRAIIGTEQEGIGTLKCSGCSEEFDTHLGLYQHCENVHKRTDSEGNGVKLSTPGDVKSPEAGSQNGKYVCRLCGMTFPLLPDLGRHHQATHMVVGNKVGAGRGTAPSKKEAGFESGRMKLPIRRKADEKADVSESSYGPARRKRKKLRFTSQRKSYERETRGPDSLRFHVQAVLQGATHRKRHKRQSDNLSSEPSRKDPSPLTQSDFIRPQESSANPNGSSSSKDGILSLSRTGPTSLSLTRRVESNIESVQEKFKLQADKIFTEFSQLHGEPSVKHESQVDGRSTPIDCEKPWNAFKGSLKQEHDLEAPKDLKSERSKSPLFYSNSSQEQLAPAERKRSNFIVTCEDLSGGQELVPIVCVIDQDVLLQLRSLSNKESGAKDVYQPSSFTYITKRRLDPSLGLVPENYKIGCTCGKAQCTPDMCEHVNLFDCDNAEACDIYGKPMRGRFPYDDQGSIILEEGYLVYECNSSCQCQQTCLNRVLQKGVTVKLEVFKTQHKGWAVRAAEKINRGTFVCEYVGEVLHDQEANKRGERYDQVGCSYLYDIDAHLDISGTGRRCKPFVIDATSQGNVARFINHSCAPNLVNYQVLVESMDAQLAHIGLFASRDIEIGEELAYDYRYRLLPGKGCPCHCGAKHCRGRLY